MKRRTTVTSAIVLLLCILIMAGGCDSNMNKANYQKSQLQSFSINTGGGMEGGSRTLNVRLDTENDIVTVYKSVSDAWYLDPGAELYAVDRALLDEIKQVIMDAKLYKAAKAPLSKMQILDGATTSFSAFFSDGEYFSYSTSQDLSSKVYDASAKIRALIEESCDGAAAYPTVYAAAEGEYEFREEQEEITIGCSNASAFRVTLNIYNGKGENAALAGDVIFSKMNGDEAVYTETLLENYTAEVYAGGQEYITVELPFDRYPEEGTYKLAYAGYETTFEMKIYEAE